MPKSDANSLSSGSIIPVRIIVGVTGHRKLYNEPLLAERVQTILKEIKQLIGPLRNTPIALSVISALAEGADRLVVQEILKTPGSQLDVILPFEKDVYKQDFELAESREVFARYLSQARRIKQIPPAPSRAEAYARAGRYVVDSCHILIALWDGQLAAGRGGTAEIVEYARRKMCPLFWINTGEEAKVTFEPGRGLSPRPYQDLDRYNSESGDNRRVEQKTEDRYRFLLEQAERAQLSTDRLHAIRELVLPHYSRADILALRYQRLYFKAGSLVYILAAAAVAVAAFQALFLQGWPRIALIEVVFILAVLAVVWLGNRRKWHSKWIDYRFLAERFRSAQFMALANLDVANLRPPRHLSLSYSSQDWMVSAFSSVWRRLPRPHGLELSEFEGLKKFTLAAWIDDQINYHEKTSERHGRRHNRLTFAGNILFGLTFVAAALHALHFGAGVFDRIFLLMAIALPAAASALSAIRTHREYLRNAKRSAEMVRHLEEIRERMTATQDFESFLQLVREAEETMLHENEDWRIVVRFHELEPPA